MHSILREEQSTRKVSIPEGIDLASTRDRHHIQPCCALVSFLSLPSIMTESSPAMDVERIALDSPPPLPVARWRGRSGRFVVTVPDSEVCS